MSEETNNIKLTFIVELLEVINRIADTIDQARLKHVIKQDFKRILHEGRRLDKDYRKYIANLTSYGDDPEEEFDRDVDFLYDIVMATRDIDTEEKYLKVLTAIKLIAK